MIDKEVSEKMMAVCCGLTKVLELSHQGFRMAAEKPAREAEEAIKEAWRRCSEFANFLISRSTSSPKEREKAKPLLSLASSFERMSYNLEGIIDRLNGMARERVFFSDRGNKEVNTVFEETISLLGSLPDLILTRNELLAEHIEEKAKIIFGKVGDFSEEHEKRLIEGVCVPKSSPIYLGLLESLKAIVAHTLEVSNKIVSVNTES
jgi:Na+/phosphate symporter